MGHPRWAPSASALQKGSLVEEGPRSSRSDGERVETTDVTKKIRTAPKVSERMLKGRLGEEADSGRQAGTPRGPTGAGRPEFTVRQPCRAQGSDPFGNCCLL